MDDEAFRGGLGVSASFETLKILTLLFVKACHLVMVSDLLAQAQTVLPAVARSCYTTENAVIGWMSDWLLGGK